MATCLDVAGVKYPSKAKSGKAPIPLVGESLLPIFQGKTRERGPISWEHEGNSAMREGKWKLVSKYPDYWELYDMEADRTEMHDIADQHPNRVKEMAAAWTIWAKHVGVQPWPMPQTPPGQVHGLGKPAPAYLRKDRW